jgi:hypothetical protein
MIISHKYKYVFIQLDKTASSAIAKELIDNYEGKPILWKHARYEDFMRIATPEEKKFFIFSGIRNPLDTTVSYYHLFKLGKSINNYFNKKRHKFIVKKNADFKVHFKRFIAIRIYEDWKTLNFNKLNFIYRYENLQEDFSKILNILNIEQKRSVPLNNKTPDKNMDFISYYDKEIQEMTKIVFKRFMKRFSYDFPKDWEELSVKGKWVILPILNIRFLFERLLKNITDNTIIYKKFYNIKE